MAIKFQIVSELPGTTVAHTLYFVKNGDTVKTYITDNTGVPFLQSSGGDDGIEPLLFSRSEG